MYDYIYTPIDFVYVYSVSTKRRHHIILCVWKYTPFIETKRSVLGNAIHKRYVSRIEYLIEQNWANWRGILIFPYKFWSTCIFLAVSVPWVWNEECICMAYCRLRSRSVPIHSRSVLLDGDYFHVLYCRQVLFGV